MDVFRIHTNPNTSPCRTQAALPSPAFTALYNITGSYLQHCCSLTTGLVSNETHGPALNLSRVRGPRPHLQTAETRRQVVTHPPSACPL